jgi:UDP-N-acetylglucosamine 2-epimerase (non-hydrolysing)
MKICIVLSTRPEIIKLANLIKIFKVNKVDFFLINTNQHYIEIMSDVFFKFFKIPKPKYNIKSTNITYGSFFSKTIKNIEKILIKEKPNYLIVQGDTNTAFAGCFAASIYNRKYFDELDKIKIIHVEAGLRSFDERMPEEINRKLIDQLSNVLFTPTNFDYKNLQKESLTVNKKVFVVGNTISDVIKINIPLTAKNKILNNLDLKKKKYFLITLHRPETVDDPIKFYNLLMNFEKIGKKLKTKFIFPVHPRTARIIKKLKIKKLDFIKLIRPLEFLDFLTLMKNSNIIFTDSGGIQEESSLIGVPCITIRTTTERQLSVKYRTNVLTGYNYNKILNAIKFFQNQKINTLKIFGDGNVSQRIFQIIKTL